MSERPAKTKPGLAKATVSRLVRRRKVVLVAAEEGVVSEMVEGADVVSEGLAREEGGSLVYYGSTSVLMPARKLGGVLPDPELHTLAEILARDPHLRLRALRIARREAASRAQGEITILRAEMTIQASPTGIVVLVDVVANVQASAVGGASR